MLRAEKVGFWKNSYRITADGGPVATWDSSMWKIGGQLVLDGRRYEVRANAWGSRYGMATEDGTVVATADRVGRKQWTVDADGRTYRFRRASIWRHEEELHAKGARVGSVKRTSPWRSDAVAELPGLPVPVQVFVLVVVLTRWDWDDAVTATSAATG